MFRERALKIVLVLVGAFFSASIYSAIGRLLDPAHSDTGDTMMMNGCPKRSKVDWPEKAST